MRYIIAIMMLLITATASADVYVQGYTRSDGTYVSPYYRSSPNSSQYDNYSSRGNYNPYTGERGYSDPSGMGDFGHTRQYNPQSLY